MTVLAHVALAFIACVFYSFVGCQRILAGLSESSPLRYLNLACGSVLLIAVVFISCVVYAKNSGLVIFALLGIVLGAAFQGLIHSRSNNHQKSDGLNSQTQLQGEGYALTLSARQIKFRLGFMQLLLFFGGIAVSCVRVAFVLEVTTAAMCGILASCLGGLNVKRYLPGTLNRWCVAVGVGCLQMLAMLWASGVFSGE